MSDEHVFKSQCDDEIRKLGSDRELHNLTSAWFARAQAHNYSYHFRWLGLPIIQYPTDIVAMQELIWQIQPDLIIETGVARGGSLIFSASMLAILDACTARMAGDLGSVARPQRRVVGVDIDIRAHNRSAIEFHPLSSYITLIQGSSIADNVVAEVTAIAKKASRVLVCLDSNHTHAHVLAELQAYAPLTTVGSYCVVFDTVVEDLPKEAFGNRPWAKGNSPKTAVWEYLRSHREFEIDQQIDHKLLISVAPEGYLHRIR